MRRPMTRHPLSVRPSHCRTDGPVRRPGANLPIDSSCTRSGRLHMRRYFASQLSGIAPPRRGAQVDDPQNHPRQLSRTGARIRVFELRQRGRALRSTEGRPTSRGVFPLPAKKGSPPIEQAYRMLAAVARSRIGLPSNLTTASN
jgi:hypothetical protein